MPPQLSKDESLCRETTDIRGLVSFDFYTWQNLFTGRGDDTENHGRGNNESEKFGEHR